MSRSLLSDTQVIGVFLMGLGLGGLFGQFTPLPWGYLWLAIVGIGTIIVSFVVPKKRLTDEWYRDQIRKNADDIPSCPHGFMIGCPICNGKDNGAN